MLSTPGLDSAPDFKKQVSDLKDGSTYDVDAKTHESLDAGIQCIVDETKEAILDDQIAAAVGHAKTEAPEQQTKAAVKNVLDVLLRNTTKWHHL